jgi:amino acid transporter
MIGSSRVLLNIGKESKAMSRFAYISPKRNTPVAALVLILIVMCSFALIGRIEVVALIANLFIFITFILVNLS